MSETDPVHGTEADRWGGWTWREPRDGSHFRTCSHCGSIHPDDLAEEIQHGLPQGNWGNPHWADTKYGWPHKMYADIPNRNPDQPFVISTTNGETPPGGSGWIRPVDAPESTIGWSDWRERTTWVLIGRRPTHHAKFYTMHLADPLLSAEARGRIEEASGLRFTFEDGHVAWQAYA
jgi:hypothetical protein